MRYVLIAGLGLFASGAAAQQGPGAGYPQPGARSAPPAHIAPSRAAGGRWGSKVDGRWWGGVNAPGGYAAYRRPARGVTVARYWTSPRFHVNDWQAYGLAQPPGGYRWVRYYDDAVLIDGRGSVYDTEFGVDWDRVDRGPVYAGDRMEAGPAYRSDGYASDDYRRREDGLGGAAIGAVAGGALGAVVAGRGDRLGGALIGAGVGGVAGYAADRAEDRGVRDRRVERRIRRGPPPAYGAGYPAPDYPYPPEPYHGGHGHSGTYTTTVPAGGSHVVHAGPGVTTVTVQSQPMVTTTTTTTEYVDEAVTYSRPARRVVGKRVYRSKLKRR
jgi:Ni/Co efflux regulator RcnB